MNAMYIDEWTVDQIRSLIFDLEHLIYEKQQEAEEE